MANWVIVGTGALGTLWALGLQRQGHSVHIYARHTDEQQVSLSCTSEQHTGSAHFPVIHNPRQAPKNAIWLIMVKAWQLEPLLTALALPHQQTLVLSHNGMGAADSLLQNYSEVYDLVTTQGAWRQSRTHSVHAGIGQSWIGRRRTPSHKVLSKNPDVSECPPWFAELSAALPPLHWCENIELKRWEKLAINCAINPLATLADAVNGVLREETYAPKLRAICEEIANLNPQLDPDRLLAEVKTVIENTAQNYCSMVQDKRAGRVTEIAFLSGYICREGQRKHVATRINCELSTQVQELTDPQ